MRRRQWRRSRERLFVTLFRIPAKLYAVSPFKENGGGNRYIQDNTRSTLVFPDFVFIKIVKKAVCRESDRYNLLIYAFNKTFFYHERLDMVYKQISGMLIGFVKYSFTIKIDRMSVF